MQGDFEWDFFLLKGFHKIFFKVLDFNPAWWSRTNLMFGCHDVCPFSIVLVIDIGYGYYVNWKSGILLKFQFGPQSWWQISLNCPQQQLQFWWDCTINCHFGHFFEALRFFNCIICLWLLKLSDRKKLPRLFKLEHHDWSQHCQDPWPKSAQITWHDVTRVWQNYPSIHCNAHT